MLSRRRSVILAGVALACTAPAASANFVVTAADPAGDAADPSPGRDIVRVALTYDRRAGSLRGGVQLAGDPIPAPANLTLFAGTSTPAGCTGYPAIGFGTLTDVNGARWVRLTARDAAPVTGEALKRFDEVAEEYEADAPRLRGERPDCVIAQLTDPADTAVVYDTAGPFPLRALPELSATIADDFKPVLAGRATTVRVRLRNVGDASTGRLRLRVAERRGLTVRHPRAVRALAPGAARTIRVRATLSRRAVKTTPVAFTATAGTAGVRATATAQLYRRSSSGGGGGGGGGTGGGKVCFAYTWLPPYSTLEPC